MIKETEASIEQLDEVLDFVNERLEIAGCDQDTKVKIAIATEEIFVNIANYAYDSIVGTASVKVEIKENPPEVLIEFVDRGKEYNPLANLDPDITLSVEDREIGGLGIFMVKEMMDYVEYQFVEGKNVLTIKKAI